MSRFVARAVLAGLGAAATLAGACMNAPRTTETFSGTLPSKASASHTIALSVDGDVEATLSSITPEVAVGLGIGTPTADGACVLLASNPAARTGTTVWTDAQPGNYCVLLYDVGNVVDTAAFTLTVSHPGSPSRP